MIDEMLNTAMVARISLYCKYEIPAWTLLQYCKKTLSTAIKCSTILNMLQLIKDGKSSTDFSIEISSKELYPIIGNIEKYNECFINKYFNYSEKWDRSLVKLSSSDDNPQRFWYLIRNQERPNVLVKDSDAWLPIYQENKRTTTYIKNISVNSPPMISLEGMGEVINDLRFGKEREIRTEIDWQNQQIGNAASNISKILDSSAKLNDPMVPEGIKAYAKEIYTSLLIKQQNLNEKIGLGNAKIEIQA
jgi:hypothetical protein